MGYVARNGGGHRRGGPGSSPDRRYRSSRIHRAGAAIHGLAAGSEHHGHSRKSRIYRQLHRARIEDLRAAAAQIRGGKIAENVTQALVVPGSGLVKAQAEAEGLADQFIAAGFEWRSAGCSMCLGMNPDQLGEEHCASTSNRNFEGRQGLCGRTHLVSPAMAAAAAMNGRLLTSGRTVNGRICAVKWAGRALGSDNVDTDQIIPKQYLKSIKRTGFGDYLFDAWRFLDQGTMGMTPNERQINRLFPNLPEYQGASINRPR